MTSSESIERAAARAAALRAMHAAPHMLVLPNAWDAASARAFASAGFEALATTSGGVSATLGYEDQEGAPVDEMLAAARRIVSAVDVPVTVDFEAGYGLEPPEITERLISVGAAGLNLEDSDHSGASPLLDAEWQAERLAAVKAAANAAGVDLVLNARVDVFIKRQGSPEEQLAEGLRRARLYSQAGADCIYPIILSDAAMLAEFVKVAPAVNLNVRRGGPISLEQAAKLGIRRVSYATSLYRETMSAVEKMAGDVRGEAGALS